MKKENVPQDPGLDFSRKLILAQDEDGRFVGVQSVGWEVSNTSFDRYWDFVGRTLNEARERVECGERSPLYYWMRVHQLTEGMLANYVGMWRWRVRRHLRPGVFSRLKPKVLARYAEALQTPIEQLQHVPEKDPEDMPIPRPGQVPPA
jgi:hypothetical protein